MAGIAAGNGRASNERNRGVAYESDLLVVKLGTPGKNSFPRTTELMLGMDYILRKALELKQPVAVNISFGNTYGSHDGTSLLETYLSDMANYWKSVLVIGTGNEGSARGHTSGQLVMGREQEVEFAVGEYEPALSLQIWKSYADIFSIRITHPSGKTVGIIRQLQGPRDLLSKERKFYYILENQALSVLFRKSILIFFRWKIISTAESIK